MNLLSYLPIAALLSIEISDFSVRGRENKKEDRGFFS